MPKIQSISIEGFKSIKNLNNLELSPGLNVLIGANGSGKSNFLSFFKFLNDIVNESLESSTKKFGGANRILHNGSKVTEQIASSIYFDHSSYGYAFQLNRCDLDVFDLKMRKQKSNSKELTIDLSSSENQETPWMSSNEVFKKEDIIKVLKNNSQKNKKDIADFFSPQIKSTFNNLKVYHFHDTSPVARVKQTCLVGDNISLHSDGGNLTAMLYKFQQANNSHYKMIVKTIQRVAPFFKDFVLEKTPENQDYMQLRWQSEGVNQTFIPGQISDGTLRFICLTTLLMQPDLPSTIIIDEPELGLHPDALILLASMLESVSTNTQVIISTQSARLVDEITTNDIIVVDRENGQSVFSRLKENDLKNWLEDYTLGELWEKNVIGGKPYSKGIF